MNTSPFYAGIGIGNKEFTQIIFNNINEAVVYYTVGHELGDFKHSLFNFAACFLPNGFLCIGRGYVSLLIQQLPYLGYCLNKAIVKQPLHIVSVTFAPYGV